MFKTSAAATPGLVIRPFVTADTVVTDGEFSGVLSRPDRWRDDQTRVVAAFDDEQIIGGGRFWSSPVHPDRYWLDVTVRPDRRREGVATVIADHLSRLRPHSRPFCAKAVDQTPAAAFLAALGGRPYQICPPQHVAPADRDRLTPQMATVPGGALDPNDIAHAWTDMDRWVHACWSPVGSDADSLLAAVLTEGFSSQHSRFIVDHDQMIRAGAFVFSDKLPCVVAECRTPDEPDGLAKLTACMHDAMAALDPDHDLITFDGHLTDPHFALCNSYPPAAAPSS